MRWHLKRPDNPTSDDQKRTIEKFLWWPKAINYEVRWLERATILQRAIRLPNGDLEWVDTRFTEFH